MVRVDTARWGQTVEDLRLASVNADHPRTRERFLALYMVASGTHNATAWAARTGRADETVLGWVHRYNDNGPDALSYKKTGGSAPLLRPCRSSRSSPSSRTPGRPSTVYPATAGR